MSHELTIFGNLGGDPDMRYTPDGTAVTTINVASDNDHYKDRKKTTWFRCVAFGKLAESMNQYLTKGQTVFITGVLSSGANGAPKIWTDKEGQPRATNEVYISRIQFGRKSAGSNEISNQSADNFEFDNSDKIPEDEIPF